MAIVAKAVLNRASFWTHQPNVVDIDCVRLPHVYRNDTDISDGAHVKVPPARCVLDCCKRKINVIPSMRKRYVRGEAVCIGVPCSNVLDIVNADGNRQRFLRDIKDTQMQHRVISPIRRKVSQATTRISRRF